MRGKCTHGVVRCQTQQMRKQQLNGFFFANVKYLISLQHLFGCNWLRRCRCRLVSIFFFVCSFSPPTLILIHAYNGSSLKLMTYFQHVVFVEGIPDAQEDARVASKMFMMRLSQQVSGPN